MRRTISALTLATVITASLSATPLVADTEFQDNIPIDLARALLRGAGNAADVKIYSDIPDEFPEFDLPDGATLVGSIDQERSQQVVLRSDGDGLVQQAALIESLQGGGYLLIDRSPGATQQTGFISPNSPVPSIPVELCHDSQGSTYIRLLPESDHTFINISASSNMDRGGYTCADRASQRPNAGFAPFLGRPPGARSLQTSLPRLTLPEEADVQSPLGRISISGSSDRYESRTEFSIDWPLTEVQAFFTDQIAGQDWELDSDSAGDRVALGAWTREDNDRLLLGTLQLVSKGDDLYEAVFAVSFLD
jgi:hypothetical protein